MLQARAEKLRLDARLIAHYRDLGCCGDCVRVRLRIAASLRAQAAWYEEWAVIYALRLQAVEQGHPKPPLVLPHLDVQPYLAEGVPAELPASSIDRCAACQKELDEVRRWRRLLALSLREAACSLWDSLAARYPV